MDQVSRLFEQLSERTLQVLVIAFVAFPALFVTVTNLVDWEATFSVDARTEIVEFTTNGQNVPNWYITVERVRVDGQDFDIGEAQLAIGPQSRVRAIRLQDGDLRLDIEAEGQDAAAEVFDAADRQIALVEERLQAIVSLPESGALTLALAGRAIIGDTIFSQSVETSPVLLEGVIKLFGLSLFTKNRFAAGEAALDTGDRLEIQYEQASDGGHGMLRIDEARPGIQAVFHTDGINARIVRFGTGGYELRPSIWARISSDPLYQALLALYAAVLPVVGIGFASMVAQRRLRRSTLAHAESGAQDPPTETERSEFEQSESKEEAQNAPA